MPAVTPARFSPEEVFKGEDGKLYMKLNWNKRWITLAAISTLLGVAFRLRDPENLLGKGEDVGITCALIPTNTPGVIVGERHDPLGVPFYNCPTQGKDVIVPIEETVVGGLDGCGKGWSMLMDCLTAGRGISLPSQSAGAGKYASRAVSAHATNRKQFGVNVGKFEGVEDPIARIVGLNYIMESCRIFTAGSIDSGIKSPVVTAIAKYFSTEMMRSVVNDAMDVLGGAGITRGPRNVMAHPYIAAPIGITVEGANIMTRTLIIFGQGALRAHPFAYQEVSAVEAGDLAGFDKAFWGHIGHIVANLCRTILLTFTRGYFVSTPGGPARRIYQKIAWSSAVFALMADVAMGTLGGALKSKGKLTGRYADILGWMYLLTCVLRRFEAEGRRKEDIPVLEFAANMGFQEMQKAFEGIFENIKVPGLSWFLMVLWLGGRV
jgi:acyl-CoA dehydrogenase